MRRITVWAISAALFSVTGLSAQEKPNFSGEWTITTPPARTDDGGLCGRQCTITQDATSLTVTRMIVAGRQGKTTFILDGSEHKVGVQDPQGRGGGVYTAMWDGNKLRISTQPSDADASILGRMEVVFSMNAGQMEVEASITGAIIQATPRKQTYTKN